MEEVSPGMIVSHSFSNSRINLLVHLYMRKSSKSVNINQLCWSGGQGRDLEDGEEKEGRRRFQIDRTLSNVKVYFI